MTGSGLPSFVALRAFEAVARHSSFSRAAMELGVTQGAVSYQIGRLQDDLGVALFRKSGRGILLTQAGEQLLPVLQQSFADIGRAVTALRAEPPRLDLTVGLSTYVATHWLSRRLASFCLHNPHITLRLQHPESSVDLADDAAHIAILWRKADWVDPTLEAALLFQSALSPVCSPRLLDEAHAVATPGDLQSHTLLRDGITREAWADWFTAAGVVPSAPLREVSINDPNVYIQAAIDGQGFALGDSVLDEEISLRRLIKPFELALAGYGYFVAWPRGALKYLSVRVFRDWLLAEARSGL